MTRLEQAALEAKRLTNHNGPSATPNSLGPVDPSWLAKLSYQLAIQPARTVAPLLMSIWPGVHPAAICCREACAYLMQVDVHSVPIQQLESNIRMAFRQRGVPIHPSLSIRAEIETDAHFIKEQRASDAEIMVRLDKTSLPAPAVASLYLNGNGSRMLTPERALYQTAIHLTWPRALTDDDEYLCCQISELLLEEVERVGIDRNLPRHSMHLTEVGGALRHRSECDPRLAVIFPKGSIAKSRRPRLSEFLGKDELKPLFRVVESRLRQSEKVVTLRTDVLLRSLGPMASLLQKSLSPTVKDSSVNPPPDLPRSIQEHAYSHQTASFPLPIPSISEQRMHGFKGDVIADALSPATGKDSVWSYPGQDSLHPKHASISHSFTRAQSMFMGLESASEVPIEIRNCWSTVDDESLNPDDATGCSIGGHNGGNGGGSSRSLLLREGNFSKTVGTSRVSTSAIEIPIHDRECSLPSGIPGPQGEGAEEDGSSEVLMAVGAVANQLDSSDLRKPGTEPSDFFSFGSEDMSDAGGYSVVTEGAPVLGGSVCAPRNGTGSHVLPLPWVTAVEGNHNASATQCGQIMTSESQSPLLPKGPSNNSVNGRCGIGVAQFGSSKEIARGLSVPVEWKDMMSHSARGDLGSSVWSQNQGGLWTLPGGGGDFSSLISDSQDGLHSHMHGNCKHLDDLSMAGHVWGQVGIPHSSSAPAYGALSGAANYAAALRSVGHTQNSQPYSPQHACALTNDVILAHLDSHGREIQAMLSPSLLDMVCDTVRRASPRVNAPTIFQVNMGMSSSMSAASMPGGPIGPPDVATEFLACVNAVAMSRPAVATQLERASEGAKRALVIAGLPAGTLPMNSHASTLAALKPMVRREVVALVDANPGILRLNHFDDGVLSHLQRRHEHLVAAALREIARRTDLPGATNKSAYLTHWLMRFADDPSIPSLAAKCAGKGGITSSPDLRRLPRSVQVAVEQLVERSPWIDWRHFDAGVMKVLQQLASTAEADTVSELRQVEVTELSSVKNMPAYLNKCFNNRLWKVRES